MSDKVRQKLVPAVQNAALALRLLAQRGKPLGATQIARETGISASSAFNILRTLSHEGLIAFDTETKTYRIGMGMLEFVSPVLGANPADLIRAGLLEIAQTHQVMIAVWQITSTDRVVLIDRIAAPRIVQASIAPESRLPAFAGAIGRVYAASRGFDLATTLEGYRSVHWQAEPGFEAYWADVQQARETRYAFDHGNLFRGLEITASLALDGEGMPRLGMSSITIAGQHETETLVAVAGDLAEEARRIERCVFGRGLEAEAPEPPARPGPAT